MEPNTLQSKAGYIDARPPTANSAKPSCDARPDHTLGHSRLLGRVPRWSGVTQQSEVRSALIHFGVAPITEGLP
jgi:hypothetical protein